MISRHRRSALLLAVALAAVDGIALAESPGLASPLDRPATMSSHAREAVTLGVARAGTRLVAVGERGLVLLSDDGGAQWRQVNVPTSVTLTAVRFVTPRTGWAVGHYGVVLKSRDGGQTWVRQFDGVAAAASAQQAALGSRDPASSQKAIVEAGRLVADGPDKPFLDLYFTDERHGFIVGAYNLIFETVDGGDHWLPRLDALDNPRGNHLYAITGEGRSVWIAGEQGVVFRSDDAGQSFTRLTTPYNGSFFALAWVQGPDGGEIVVAGLRGNVLRSGDRGMSWSRLDGLPPVSILSAGVAEDRSLWLGNQAGQVFVSRDGGASFALSPSPPGLPPLPLTQLLPTAQGVVVATLRGVQRLVTPSVR